MKPEAIPVTLLTGFLGSGKSTLLTEVLSDPSFSDTAVVVNEFGDVGLDGFLVEHSLEQMVEMTSGCLCCTIRGDIRETLLDLYRRRELGEIPRFSPPGGRDDRIGGSGAGDSHADGRATANGPL